MPAAFAAEVDDATIDQDQKGSLTIYKYDLTNAEKDGVWDSSYVSTGAMDQAGVVDILGGTDNKTDLGNGEESYGYALKGVEFSYVKIAEIVQFSEPAEDGRPTNQVEVLYGIDKVKGADFLKALGLENGAERNANADYLDTGKYFYRSDILINALAKRLETNPTIMKNALERYLNDNGGVKMAPTDSYGKTQVTDLDLGLYLIVETAVPEQVVSTTNPFLVSVPMTAVNGTNATDGGERWIYDITVFPKNLTGMPSLEKTLREQISDTGKNDGSTTDITDGYEHTESASAGDVIDYQIISTLPSITSESTYLTCYTFVDTLSSGLCYNKNDVVLEFFADEACTDLVATWTEADGYFAVTYADDSNGVHVMTVEMTPQGLSELNSSKAVYSSTEMVNSGFSDCTLRITYQATMGSDNAVAFGDDGNPNDVALTWKRTNSSYYDTLVDDAQVYTYGIELTKLFSDGKGNFANVEFVIHNDTDNYFVKAELNETEGVYYVTGHVEHEADATRFVPVVPEGTADGDYKVIVKGLEDDSYTVTEVRTDNGYTLLKEDIAVVIARAGSTASATVDSKTVNMLEDNGSNNALVPLTVVNTRGFDLPETGDNGTMMFTIFGVLAMAGATVVIILAFRKKRNIS